MKKFLMGTVGLVALGMAAPASAADLAARPYTKAPPPMIAIYDWTGFYIGGNGGWGSSRNCWGIVPVAGAIIPTVASASPEASPVASSATVGRPVSLSSAWKARATGQICTARMSAFSIRRFSTATKVDGIGLFTGQVGWAWNAALLYFKGGAAVTSNRYDVFTTLTGVGLASATSTRWGGTVGVGFEYGFSPNWSAGIEYDHLFMGDSNNSFSVANPLLAGSLNRISQDVDMVTFRVNYRFGGFGGPPVTARY